MQTRIKILFLCTGNSCRSQMAEGFANNLKNSPFEGHSAGVRKSTLNPWAVKVMNEIGIDISAQYSKHVEDVKNIPFDVVLTVCDHAKETCPFFPGSGVVIHHTFDDPPALTEHETDENTRLDVYRRVRDEIKLYIESLPEKIQELKGEQK